MTAATKKIKPTYWIHSAIAISFMLFFRFLPAPEPLTPYGMALLGIFIGAVYGWCTVSMIWPSLLALTLMGLTLGVTWCGAIVGVSSYIFINDFGTSEQMYSFYYAITALLAITGPMIYIRFLYNFNRRRLSELCFILIGVCGILLILTGTTSVLLFTGIVTAFSIVCSMIRPFSMNILFAQTSTDTGSVSALYNAVNFAFGSLGMTICSMDWGSRIVSLGVILLLTALLELALWECLMKSRIPCRSVKA